MSKRVLLIDPFADPVVSWGQLEASPETRFAVAQELVSIFRHFWRDAWGPRLEELLLMTLLALTAARLTILEAIPFLTLAEFRRYVLRHVDIPDVTEFWTLRFDRLSPSQRSSFVEPVLNKLRVFQDPAIKYLVGQQQRTLDFDRALVEGQTIIANFPSGRLHGSNYLLGALLLAKFKGALYRRPANAPPYALVLDEFQEMLAW